MKMNKPLSCTREMHFYKKVGKAEMCMYCGAYSKSTSLIDIMKPYLHKIHQAQMRLFIELKNQIARKID